MTLTLDHELASLLERPVAVLGAGVSGRAAAALVRRLGGKATIYDEKGGEGRAHEFLPDGLRECHLVVISPGFRVEHPWLEAARAAGRTCWGELDLAARLWRGKLLAITGTNGKTTLTEFLTHALRASGQQADGTGNIGYSFCRLVDERDGGTPESWAVCEVSSFQAEVLQHFHAHGVLWTNFAEDHLERHPGLEAYFAAKERLLRLAAPQAVIRYGTSVRSAAERLGRVLPAAGAVATEGLAADAQLAGTVFADYPQRENFVLAAAWWQEAGFAADALVAAARSFRLGRHRLAWVAEANGVTWWNDSKATNFHAVEAALGRFPAPVLLIAGGKAKGGDLAGFVRRIAPRVREVFLLGETRQVLASFCVAYHVPHQVCGTLEEAVLAAGRAARPGEQVLLSPGFASFDMFRGYDDRGDQFEQLVRTRFVAVATPAQFS